MNFFRRHLVMEIAMFFTRASTQDLSLSMLESFQSLGFLLWDQSLLSKGHALVHFVCSRAQGFFRNGPQLRGCRWRIATKCDYWILVYWYVTFIHRINMVIKYFFDQRIPTISKMFQQLTWFRVCLALP